MTLSHSSGVMRWKIWSRRMPALFTTMSMRPKWSSADCTILPALSQDGDAVGVDLGLRRRAAR